MTQLRNMQDNPAAFVFFGVALNKSQAPEDLHNCTLDIARKINPNSFGCWDVPWMLPSQLNVRRAWRALWLLVLRNVTTTRCLCFFVLCFLFRIFAAKEGPSRVELQGRAPLLMRWNPSRILLSFPTQVLRYTEYATSRSGEAIPATWSENVHDQCT